MVIEIFFIKSLLLHATRIWLLISIIKISKKTNFIDLIRISRHTFSYVESCYHCYNKYYHTHENGILYANLSFKSTSNQGGYTLPLT